MSVEELKLQANDEFKLGRFEQAAALYTKAIEAGGDANAKLYTNRAAAYLRLQRPQEALRDATRAEFLDSTFFKGALYRGQSFMMLGRVDEAVTALEKGLAVAPGNAKLTEALEYAREARRTRASAGSGTAAAGAGGAAAASAGGAGGMKPLQTAHMVLRGLVCFSTILYLIPLGASITLPSYRRALYMCIGSFLLSLYETHGKPKFNKEFLVQVISDVTAQFLFMAIILLGARPYMIAIIVLTVFEFVHFGNYAYLSASAAVPALAGILATIGHKLGAAIAQNPEFDTMTPAQKWATVTPRILQLASHGQVALGILVIIELFTPMRNFLFLFMYWQFLQLRYVLSAEMKASFAALDGRIVKYLGYLPPVAMTLYVKVRGFLAARVQAPVPAAGGGGGGGSGFPSCSVM